MERWDCRHLLFFYAFVGNAIRFFDIEFNSRTQLAFLSVGQS